MSFDLEHLCSFCVRLCVCCCLRRYPIIRIVCTLSRFSVQKSIFDCALRGVALNLISNVLEKQIRNVCTCVCPCVITFACAERFGLSQRQKVHDQDKFRSIRFGWRRKNGNPLHATIYPTLCNTRRYLIQIPDPSRVCVGVFEQASATIYKAGRVTPGHTLENLRSSGSIQAF